MNSRFNQKENWLSFQKEIWKEQKTERREKPDQIECSSLELRGEEFVSQKEIFARVKRKMFQHSDKSIGLLGEEDLSPSTERGVSALRQQYSKGRIP